MAIDQEDIPPPKQRQLLWLFLALLLLVGVLLWLIGQWNAAILSQKQKESPFLQVTHRDFSVFLWQHPQFLRSQRGLRPGEWPQVHLPQEIPLSPEEASLYVDAPEEVLFRYHTWDRLLSEASIGLRSIEPEAFAQFLQENPAWQPKHWPEAPEGYGDVVKLANDLEGMLPLEVKLAFQGWKNTTQDWEQIEQMQVSDDALARFLQEHSAYKTSLWQNIEPGYPQEMPDFLRIALYNFKPQ